jgi:hypothetical protein
MNNSIKNKIINKFNLSGIEWNVEFAEQLKQYTVLGLCSNTKCLIEIAKNANDYTVNEKSFIRTILHEIVHAILIDSSYFDLSSDETFVDNFSGKLTEVLTTANFIDLESTK